MSDLSGRDVLRLATTADLTEVQDYYNRFLVHSAISIAEWEIVKKETDIAPYCFGGLSLGEMISVHLVEQVTVRELVSAIFIGEDQFLSSGLNQNCAFIWVQGFPLENLQNMFGNCLGERNETFLSTIISDDAFTISASKKGAEEIIKRLKKNGLAFAVYDNMGGVHSPLISEFAMRMLHERLNHIKMKNNKFPVLSATDGGRLVECYRPINMVENLLKVNDFPGMIRVALEAGIDTFLHLGPMDGIHFVTQRLVGDKAVVYGSGGLLKGLIAGLNRRKEAPGHHLSFSPVQTAKPLSASENGNQAKRQAVKPEQETSTAVSATCGSPLFPGNQEASTEPYHKEPSPSENLILPPMPDSLTESMSGTSSPYASTPLEQLQIMLMETNARAHESFLDLSQGAIRVLAELADQQRALCHEWNMDGPGFVIDEGDEKRL